MVPLFPNVGDRVVMPKDSRVLRILSIESGEAGLYEPRRKGRGAVARVKADRLDWDSKAGVWRPR